MDLTVLLKFIPLLIGAFLAYHLIFKLSLPSKKLGEMATYFIGIVIVLVVVSWLITSFLAGWATDLLQTGTASNEWQNFINESEGVVDDAFSPDIQPTAQPTPVQLSNPIAPTPIPGNTVFGGSGSAAAPRQYTVVAGDTLTNIAARFGVSMQDIVIANGIANPNTLSVGQVLIIPAASQ